MKSYNELKAEMEEIHQKIVKAKSDERANVKRIYKEFGFSAGMLLGALSKGRRKQ